MQLIMGEGEKISIVGFKGRFGSHLILEGKNGGVSIVLKFDPKIRKLTKKEVKVIDDSLSIAP